MSDAKTRTDLIPGDLRAGANPLEIACVNGVQTTDPNCVYNFVRKFQHRDWIDGESLVQAGKTPEEGGINERLHNIEQDLDALGDNVRRAFARIATLKAQLSICLNEIVTILNAKAKDDKEKEESKDTKDTKDSADTKNNKDTKDNKDTKENHDAKQDKDGKDAKDNKEDKDDNEKHATKELLGAAEKKDADHLGARFSTDGFHRNHPLLEYLPVIASPTRSGLRVFIGPVERPLLGERALNEAPRE
jgi:hypothetical protein